MGSNGAWHARLRGGNSARSRAVFWRAFLSGIAVFTLGAILVLVQVAPGMARPVSRAVSGPLAGGAQMANMGPASAKPAPQIVGLSATPDTVELNAQGRAVPVAPSQNVAPPPEESAAPPAQIQVSGRVRVPAESAEIKNARLELFFSARAVASMEQLSSWLKQKSDWQFGYLTRVGTLRLATLDSEQTFTFTLPLSALPAMNRNQWGPRGFQVTLYSNAGRELATARSLVLVSPPATESATGGRPAVELSLLAPLTARAAALSTFIGEARVAADIFSRREVGVNPYPAPQLKEAAALVGSLSRPGLNWLLDPALVSPWGALSTGLLAADAQNLSARQERARKQPADTERARPQTPEAPAAQTGPRAGEEKRPTPETEPANAQTSPEPSPGEVTGEALAAGNAAKAETNATTPRARGAESELSAFASPAVLAREWVSALERAKMAGGSLRLGGWALPNVASLAPDYADLAAGRARLTADALSEEGLERELLDAVGVRFAPAVEGESTLSVPADFERFLSASDPDDAYLNTQLARAFTALFGRAGSSVAPHLVGRLEVNALCSGPLRERALRVLSDPWVRPTNLDNAAFILVDQDLPDLQGATEAHADATASTLSPSPTPQTEEPASTGQKGESREKANPYDSQPSAHLDPYRPASANSREESTERRAQERVRELCANLRHATDEWKAVCDPLDSLVLFTASPVFGVQEQSRAAELLESQVEALRGGVQVQEGAPISMISARADMPVKVVSQFPFAMKVQVRIAPVGAQLLARESSDAILAPLGGFTVKVPIEARYNGRASAQVRVGVSWAGEFYELGAPQTVRVSVHASWEDNIFYGIAALMLLLFAFGAYKSLRRGRKFAGGATDSSPGNATDKR